MIKEPEAAVEVLELPIVETEFERKMRLWLEALESDRYMQATGALFNGGGYCCLGVADKEIFNATFKQNRLGLYVDDTGGISSLESSRLEALKLNTPVTEDDARIADECLDLDLGVPPRWTTDHSYHSPYVRLDFLVMLNDTECKSFSEIAKFIRAAGWDKEDSSVD